MKYRENSCPAIGNVGVISGCSQSSVYNFYSFHGQGKSLRNTCLKQSALEGGKVVNPTHRPPLPLPPGRYLLLISVTG
jgi:hypothetical protein